jgi:hypothetical protein
MMKLDLWRAAASVVVLLVVGASTPAAVQRGGQGRGMGGGMMADPPGHQADMELFHALLDNREQIVRKVTVVADGVDTLTESDIPEVAKTIQAHVASMSARVKEARPIHQRDPLFREIFKHSDKIVMKHELTPRGVRVIETSSDAYVAKLIKAHAEVIDAFLANGRSEVMKNHPVPEKSK